MKIFMSYSELLEKIDCDKINYAILLKTKEWRIRREEIIKRDSRKCQNCKKGETDYEQGYHITHIPPSNLDEYIEKGGDIEVSDKPYYLHVHHKYYEINKLPWEYADDALITLCNWCHFELHEKEVIKVYLEGEKEVELSPCGRCNGAGWLPQYSHVQAGVCFRCNGNRFKQDLFKIIKKKD